MDFKQIQELIKLVNKTNISELKVDQGDFKISIRSNDYVQGRRQEPLQQFSVAPAGVSPILTPEPVATAGGHATEAAAAGAGEDEEGKYLTFRSPMIGTFYRKSAPDKDPFVKVNDQIKTGDVICIIEAMKLFNEIEFEGEGKVVKILVEDSTPVEYDQPLFLIDPS